MPDFVISDDEVQDELAEPGTDASELNVVDDLPTDPEDLKAYALQKSQEADSARREASRNKREAERQQTRADENEVAKNTWFKAFEKATSQPGDKPGEQRKPGVKAAPDDDDFSGLKGEELADHVTAEDGTQNLAKSLRDKAGFVTEKRVKSLLSEVLDERDRRAEKANSLSVALTTEFPDLAKPDSDLRKETDFRANEYIEGGMEPTAAYELAAARAALELGVKPKERPRPVSSIATNRQRLQRAQSGVQRSAPPTPAAIPISPKLQREAARIGISEKDMQQIARDVQQRNQGNRAR